MKLTLGGSFQKKLKRAIEKYNFEIGILDDKEHKQGIDQPIGKTPTLGSFAGGPVRPKSRLSSGKSISQIFLELMKRENVDLLREPLDDNDSDINKFTTEFLKSAVANKSMNRVRNLLQAIVRNPILRGDYGENNPTAADNKGFNRKFIDTAQLFKAIKAKVTRV